MSPARGSRSARRPLSALTAMLAAGAALTGCAGGPPVEEAAAEVPAATGTAQPCHGQAAATALPAGFPRDLPLPDGAMVTGSERRSGDRLIVTAVSAAGFRPTLRMLQQRLPAAGYRLTEGEVEEHDAESNFTSAKLQGRWTLREIPGCGGDVLVTVLVAPR